MATITVSLGTLVDRALLELQSPMEQGLLVVLNADNLSSTVDTTLTLTDGSGVNVNDMIQFGAELVLVTAKTTDAVPVFTVARGYYGTTAAIAAVGTVGIVNPPWPRVRIAEAIRRSFVRLEALGLPLIKAAAYTRTTGLQQVAIPEEVRRVLQVRYVATDTGKIINVDRWQFEDRLPTATFATGKVLILPTYVRNTDQLQVTYQAPYRWSTYPANPVEASTVDLPEGADDLPALYASAWLVSRREISRSQIDRSEEWNASENQKGGVSSTLPRVLWQEFYRALDETRRLNPAPIHRPYVPMPRIHSRPASLSSQY